MRWQREISESGKHKAQKPTVESSCIIRKLLRHDPQPKGNMKERRYNGVYILVIVQGQSDDVLD